MDNSYVKGTSMQIGGSGVSESFYWVYGCVMLMGGAGLGRLCYFWANAYVKRELALRNEAFCKIVNCRLVQFINILLLFSLLLRFHWSWQLGKFVVLGCLLLAISLIDYYSFLIPNSLLLLGLLLYVPLSLLAGQAMLDLLLQGVLNGCLAAAPLLVFILIADGLLQQETMGGGDIKLFFLLGVYMGPSWTFLTLFLSCLVGLLWQLWRQSLRRGAMLPFGPSIAVAAWLVLLWGERMMDWYWQFLL